MTGEELFKQRTAWEIVYLMNTIPSYGIQLLAPRELEDPELRAGYASALRQFCGWLGGEVTSIAYPDRIPIEPPAGIAPPKLPIISVRFSLPRGCNR